MQSGVIDSPDIAALFMSLLRNMVFVFFEICSRALLSTFVVFEEDV